VLECDHVPPSKGTTPFVGPSRSALPRLSALPGGGSGTPRPFSLGAGAVWPHRTNVNTSVFSLNVKPV